MNQPAHSLAPLSSLEISGAISARVIHDLANLVSGIIGNAEYAQDAEADPASRQKALKAQRGKVRELLAQAILAQVRKLAKEERFEFMSETDAQKLKLFVKLSDDHAVVLHIPFKDFKRLLPELRSAIVTLRQLYHNGIRFQIVGRGGLPWSTFAGYAARPGLPVRVMVPVPPGLVVFSIC